MEKSVCADPYTYLDQSNIPCLLSGMVIVFAALAVSFWWLGVVIGTYAVVNFNHVVVIRVD